MGIAYKLRKQVGVSKLKNVAITIRKGIIV
jgi:hypothetical protein